MLQITIPEKEFFDEKNNIFFTTKQTQIALEHSLVSLSKWESKWKKPFIDNKDLTNEQLIDYIRCMTITQNVDPIVYNGLTRENMEQVKDYISDTMTATWFNEDKTKCGKKNTEAITSELIYFWMVSYQIPFECQKWHLNRLLTLIRICNIKNQPPKKYSKKETMSKNAALNAARRKKLGTTG